MAAWIASLRDAALERREGAAPERLQALPSELAALYAEMNGATLLGEVRLFPLEESPFPPEGEGSWRFGQKGSHQHLLTLPKRTVAEALAGAAEPTWLSEVGEGEWLYGVKEGSQGPLRLFRTLETMLGVLIPPPKEEFGEQTYARAVAAVHETLAGVTAKEALRSAPEGTASDEEVTPSVANPLPPEAFGDEAPAPQAKKPAAPKKREVAPKRSVAVARKAAAAKRPAAKKSAVAKKHPAAATKRPVDAKRAAAKSAPAKSKKATGRKPAKAMASRNAAKRAPKVKAKRAATRKPAKKAASSSRKSASSRSKKTARGKRR